MQQNGQETKNTTGNMLVVSPSVGVEREEVDWEDDCDGWEDDGSIWGSPNGKGHVTDNALIAWFKNVLDGDPTFSHKIEMKVCLLLIHYTSYLSSFHMRSSSFKVVDNKCKCNNGTGIVM